MFSYIVFLFNIFPVILLLNKKNYIISFLQITTFAVWNLNQPHKLMPILKICALDFIVLKLAKWQIDDQEITIQRFNEINNFSREKLLILPYIILTANGESNRKLLFENAFDKFMVDVNNAYYESEIKASLEANDFGSSKYINYEDNTKIEIKDISVLSKIDNLYDQDTTIDNIKFSKAKEGIKHSIENVLKQKYDQKIYSYNFDKLLYNVMKSGVINKIIENNYFERQILPEHILLIERSVFAEENSHRIFA